jgi:hypothetical protein
MLEEKPASVQNTAGLPSNLTPNIETRGTHAQYYAIRFLGLQSQ